MIDLLSYDRIIVFFSGGKDSLACLLHLLELGAPVEKIELWHHLVDGQSGHFMDWPITASYCKAVATHFGLPIYFSWKTDGFFGELMRENQKTKPMVFESPSGLMVAGGKRGNESTRRRFPQQTGNLSERWCSAYLKIDVASIALNNDPRFVGKRILTISGERAEESPGRAKYSEFEPDRSDSRNARRNAKHVDRWRPIHKWTETNVWSLIEQYAINPHPAYHLGWGRCSCMFCIFGSPNQWASARLVNPSGFGFIAELEQDFGWTINRNNRSITDLANVGDPYEMSTRIIQLAMSEEYNEPIIVDTWVLPAGAFGESCGPT